VVYEGDAGQQIIAAIGKDVRDFEIGDELYGMNDWFADGATGAIDNERLQSLEEIKRPTSGVVTMRS